MKDGLYTPEIRKGLRSVIRKNKNYTYIYLKNSYGKDDFLWILKHI
ncbi:hypothetical protein [Virgibacillus proomii]|nr:hypothetical protein [Virgibacillus proomii]MBU5265582.1 hypothetical protein [Virgibacillus proomii]